MSHRLVPCKHIMFQPLALGDFGLSCKEYLQISSEYHNNSIVVQPSGNRSLWHSPKTNPTTRQSKAEAVAEFGGMQLESKSVVNGAEALGQHTDSLFSSHVSMQLERQTSICPTSSRLADLVPWNRMLSIHSKLHIIRSQKLCQTITTWRFS